MKIAILADKIDTEIFNGQTNYAFNLISGFNRKGVDNTLFYADIPELTRYPRSKKASYRLYGLPLINERIKDWLINIKVSGYDILHCLTNTGIPHGRSKAKKVVTLHDIMPFKHPEFYTEYTISYIIKGIKEALKIADAIITVSEFSKNDIVKTLNYDSSKVFVVYNGIDHNLFSRKDVSPLFSEKYILYVGGLTPRKGLSYLLEAFSRIKDRLPHKLVLIDSKGWRDTRIYKIINEFNLIDRVVLKKADTRDEMVSYYNHAAMLVFPSLYEGFGLPPLEAMACGCPVITSDNTSLQEIYEGYALLVDPADTNVLAEKILRVAKDNKLKRKMIENGITLSAKLTQERMVADSLGAYEKILES